jgi:flagellar M-ring protein FliF
VIAILLGGYAFTSWAAKPSMVPLFTNLASADAAAITETLSGKGTKYELEAGGSTVMVPQKDVYQLRLDLSAEGLPQDGTTGYELLDKQGITTSEFRQRVDYQRALEGELSKTITSIDGVQATTVHLVIPEENLFADEAREPSASVLIKNKPGQKMDIGKVQAVVKLVASSVEGLEQERVTVADSKGLVLSAPGEDGATVAAGDARAVQTATFEQNLQTSVEQMLAPLVGDGKAVVRVRAVLDFDKRSTKTESFETDKKAPVVLEKTGKEAYTGAGQTVGGVLGPENVELPRGRRRHQVRQGPERAAVRRGQDDRGGGRRTRHRAAAVRRRRAGQRGRPGHHHRRRQAAGRRGRRDWTPSAATWWRSTAWRSTRPPRPRPRRSSPPSRRPPRPSSAGA